MPIYTEQLVRQGEITERVLSDDEAADYYPPQLMFSADEQRVCADGQSAVTITVQSMSVPLSDGRRREIHGARTVTILEDGEVTALELDTHGRAEFQRAFAAAGEYTFEPTSLIAGVGITITAE